MHKLQRASERDMPAKQKATFRNRAVRAVEAFPTCTDTISSALIKSESVAVPVATATTLRNDDAYQLESCLDPELRRRWIEEVERRSVQHRRDLLMIQQSPSKEPVSSLPVICKDQAPHAFEFFKDVYVPTNSSSPGFKTYCQFVLQDGMLFEQMMAYSLAMQHMDQKPRRRLTAQALSHSNRSVMQLRQRLQAPNVDDRTSDAVVMTILLLIAFYVTCGDPGPWSLHMKALRRITAVRGGADKLGWDGFLQTKVTQVEAAWTTFDARQTVVDQAETVLAYPAHPFAPALCLQIAMLPKGFGELALRHRLSLQFIDVIEEVLHRMKDEANMPSAIAVTSVMEDVITRPELTALERVLAIAVISLCIYKAHAREGIPPTVEIARQLHARSFSSARGMYNEGSPEEDAFDWAALVVRATTTKDTIAWNWADHRVKTGPASLTLGPKREQLQEQFLHIPS